MNCKVVVTDEGMVLQVIAFNGIESAILDANVNDFIEVSIISEPDER